MKERLTKVPDIARAFSRLSLRRGGPRDLLSIVQGLIEINDLIRDILMSSKEKRFEDAFYSLQKKYIKIKTLLILLKN